MIFNIDDNFWNNSLANFTGTIFATFVTSVLGIGLFKPLRKWFYKQNANLTKVLLVIFDFLTHPILWLTVFFVFQAMIFFDFNKTLGLTASCVILVRFFFFPRKFDSSYPSVSSQFSDEFHRLEDIKKSWDTITGNPTLDEGKGNPRPSLQLNLMNPDEATNTFLLLKKIKSDRGVIECDVFLNEGSVLNIVFMCDKDNHNWHMARYDSRGSNTDGFVIKDSGNGANWRLNSMSTARTNSGTWYKVKVEFNSERARMFRDGELIEEIVNPQVFGNNVGLFNECADVSVDNFKFSII